MKANETKVENFLSSNNTQFIIPVYQRNYDWNIIQCKQLLDDILEVGINHNTNAHFIGSIVYIHDDVYTSSRINKLTIIDGQQRLTTLTLIYLAMYRLYIEMGKEERKTEILEMYLTNKFASEQERLKLRPTENNNNAIKYILRGDADEEFNGFSRVIENFNYFKNRITPENIETVFDGLSKLMFVEISLERDKDDPQRIFESLNSTGLALSQADLIRNYILMDLNYENQHKIYSQYWEIIENLAKDQVHNESKVSDFIRDYLTLTSGNIPTKNKVYTEFKIKYPKTDLQTLESNLAPIKSLAKYYNKLLNPKNESDKEIKQQLDYINRLEVNVAYPFLMKVYEDYAQNIIEKSTFVDVLELIQSYVWRRFIVGMPTNTLNKTFANLYKDIDSKNYLLSLQKSLLKKKGSANFPRDKEVREALLHKNVYDIKSKNRSYLFERLENFQNNEPVMIDNNPNITIEHIFPKNPNPKWKIELGDKAYERLKESYLNTLANLTLSGNNSALSNRYFTEKRDASDVGYKDSRLWLNKFLASAPKWDEEEILKRAEILINRFIQIWGLPKVSVENEGIEEINIFDAEDPTNKKLDYAIFFNQKIYVKHMIDLYTEVFKYFFELSPETFFSTDLAEKINLTQKAEALRKPAAINNAYFIEGNLSSTAICDKIKYALKLFNVEEELSIKYIEE
ncbi:hypothetical protein UMN179_01673 [Gallibacterium anatis UMN179]|uniref:DUF262 domain-containing protein n=1 Tax=Gallibacterium anatis (strain UMN179) TaxID=1005058 RepID=F4HCK2_GALAU|nr:DUF262 domain-containing protein [Gallibacterium anatis]AEC17690.1 hypothetical protein UMN179_01673 [Gallibacterium anatis UMN179]